MLGDFSRNAWYIRGSPRKDVSVGTEEVSERAFLFGGKCGANAHHFAFGAARVYEDLLGALYRLKRPRQPLGSGASSMTSSLMATSSSRGNNSRGVFAALDLALVGMLEGDVNGDDPHGPSIFNFR